MSRLQRTVVLVSLITVFLTANIILPQFFWHSYLSRLHTFAWYLAMGGLVAELLLLAIWAALGAMTLGFRLPLSGALVLAAVCAYLTGLQVSEADMPLEIAVLLIVAATAIYVAAQLPLWVIRVAARQRIDLPENANVRRGSEKPQFGLRHLLACMAIIAIVAVLVKHALPTGDDPAIVSWHVTLVGGAIITVFAALVCLPTVQLALSAKFSRNHLAWWVGTLCIGPLIVIMAAYVLLPVDPLDGGAVLAAFLFGLGIGGTTLLVLLICRALGYRLIRTTRATPVHAE